MFKLLSYFLGFVFPILRFVSFSLGDVNTSRKCFLLNLFLTQESLVDYFLYAKATGSEFYESGSSRLIELLLLIGCQNDWPN